VHHLRATLSGGVKHLTYKDVGGGVKHLVMDCPVAPDSLCCPGSTPRSKVQVVFSANSCPDISGSTFTLTEVASCIWSFVLGSGFAVTLGTAPGAWQVGYGGSSHPCGAWNKSFGLGGTGCGWTSLTFTTTAPGLCGSNDCGGSCTVTTL
jgi:hypothetical protein